MEIVYTFSNTHDVIAGEKALLEQGIKVRVMALPAQIGAGCGLCLRIAPDDLLQAEEIFRTTGISFEGSYEMERIDGKPQYKKR